MIRIGVDVWNLPGDRRGIGRYVRSILGAWAGAAATRVEITLVVPERPAWIVRRRYARELAGRRYRMRSRAGLRPPDFDVLWFPFNGASWSDTFGGPAVATLHDASTFVLPGFDDAARATFRAAAARCTHIITDSQFSAAELARVLPIAPSAISAISLGVDPPRPPGRSSVDIAALGRYVLVVGTQEPRKEFALVLAAVERLRAHHPALRVVLAGTQTAPLAPQASRFVDELGYVDDDTLGALYRGCAATVYASSYEGFGLPILEAMSYGAPVVAAQSSALPEAGGDAALYAPVGDAAAFAAALGRLLTEPDLVARQRERGVARAAALSWSATADRTLAVFEDVVARARARARS